ncbi:hypothetical protein RJT34_03526 [Clitoria ternatea]|uniref:Uncharacterized protein n=1 Tax=Clitoria ternatea TaxID=43366 RepID=A0AAN9KN54_CLITE
MIQVPNPYVAAATQGPIAYTPHFRPPMVRAQMPQPMPYHHPQQVIRPLDHNQNTRNPNNERIPVQLLQQTVMSSIDAFIKSFSPMEPQLSKLEPFKVSSSIAKVGNSQSLLLNYQSWHSLESFPQNAKAGTPQNPFPKLPKLAPLKISSSTPKLTLLRILSSKHQSWHFSKSLPQVAKVGTI